MMKFNFKLHLLKLLGIILIIVGSWSILTIRALHWQLAPDLTEMEILKLFWEVFVFASIAMAVGIHLVFKEEKK